MQTTVDKRSRVLIPAAIRARYHIQPGDSLMWLDDGKTIKLVPIPRDPIRALRGRANGEDLLTRLLAERRADAERDE